MIDARKRETPGAFSALRCAIEPAAHSEIYRLIQETLEKPFGRSLAEQLSYVIIKGNYAEFTIILNVRTLSGKLVSAANTLSKSLTRKVPSVNGFFLYLNESGGNYYLGSTNPKAHPEVRRLFGKGLIYQKVCGKSFLYSPLSFSQVNQSMLERIVAEADRLLELDKSSRLFDLYCGYGLFALCLGGKAGSVVGVEISPEAVESADANAERQRAKDIRFIRSDITAGAVARIIARARPGDAVLLDPPRNGTAEGVIEAIAAAGPGKALHFFCNIDLMPAEITRWLSNGYTLRHAVPLDMFPGTAAVETAALFEKSA